MPLRALRRQMANSHVLLSESWRKTSCPCGHCDECVQNSSSFFCSQVEKDIMPLRALRPGVHFRYPFYWQFCPVEKDIMPLRALRRIDHWAILYSSSLWRKTSCPCGHCDCVYCERIIHSSIVEKDIMPLRALRRGGQATDVELLRGVEKDIMPLRALRRAP